MIHLFSVLLSNITTSFSFFYAFVIILKITLKIENIYKIICAAKISYGKRYIVFLYNTSSVQRFHIRLILNYDILDVFNVFFYVPHTYS